MIKYVLLVALFALAYGEDLKSPCPELFEYGKADKGAYEATLILKSDAKLYGVWARLFFDKPVTIKTLPVSKSNYYFFHLFKYKKKT